MAPRQSQGTSITSNNNIPSIFFNWCMHAMSPLSYMLFVCVWWALCTQAHPRKFPGNYRELSRNSTPRLRPGETSACQSKLSFIDAVTVHPASLVWPVTAGLVPFQLMLPRLAPRLHLGASRRCWAVTADRKHRQHPVVHRRS